jgi:hypothetical protein
MARKYNDKTLAHLCAFSMRNSPMPEKMSSF